jgi:hypothetical protein
MRHRDLPYTGGEQEMRTGLVLSVRGRDVTVIGPGGAVQRMRLPYGGARPGDRVPLHEAGFVVRGLSLPVAVRGLRLAGVFAAAMVLALLITSIGLYFSPLPAVAMVSVDINPSVNVYVNSVLRVVSAQAADEAGEALLKDLSPARQPLGEFLLLLAGKAAPTIAQADEDRWLIIGVTPLHEGEVLSKAFLSRLEDIRRGAAAQLAKAVGREPGTLPSAVIEVPPQVATAARESGVTPGQYVVMLAAQDSGIDVRISDTRAMGLFGAVTAAGGKPGEILSRAAKDKDLEETWKNNRAQVGTERPTGSQSGGPDGTPKSPDGAGKPPAPPQPGPGPGSSGGTGGAGTGQTPVPPGQVSDPGQVGGGGKGSKHEYPVVRGKGPDEAKQRAGEVVDRIRQFLGDGGVGRATNKAGKGR